jgi:hypothetical protein
MTSKTFQSTNHILMIEPSVFYANPQTMDTNAYQVAEHEPREVIYQKALHEFSAFRDKLTAKGVIITQMRGHKECPDMIFSNCMSTHQNGRMYLYPMYNENRRAEHSEDLIAVLSQSYPDVQDWRHYAKQEKYLESTASIVRDSVNKIGYVGLSARTSKELAQKWLDEMGYKAVIFETKSHAGIPVYHTDCVMWIGTTLAGICTPAITDDYRDTVLTGLQSTHTVVEFSMQQLRTFCGNALEVRGKNGKLYLAMSTGAYQSLTKEQSALIHDHFEDVIHSDLSALEIYGGGSARCMMMELF